MPPPANPGLPTWAVEFHPFTWLHALSLVWTIGPVLAACLLGRAFLRRGRADLEERLALVWAGLCIGINLWSIIYWQLPAQFNLKESLPLQLCDLACLVAPFAFITPGGCRWARTLLFFWGIGLSTQAFFTPTVLEGPADTKYHLFWLVHTAIVGSAVYDLVVRRFRPAARDLLLAIGLTILYALAMVPLNAALDANYGFIGNQLRGRPTIVDKLGPWPERIFIMAAIVFGGFAIMWAIARAFTPRPTEHR